MAFTIKGSCMVRPVEPTWTGRLPLSALDQTDCVGYITFVCFYKHPQNGLSPYSSISSTLKNSLSKALVPFYPLAGRLQPIGNGRLELDCNGKGVSFIEAETELTIADLGDFTPKPQHRFIVPTVDSSIPIHEKPILLVQLTSFRCGGYCIAVHVSHAVLDGRSGQHFLFEWSRLNRGEPLHTMPFHDRKLVLTAEPLMAMASTSTFRHIEYLNPPLILGKNDSLEERRKEITVAILRLTVNQVERLKKIAEETWERPNGHGYTRYETLTGHIWRSACKARGHKYEQPTVVDIPVDIRNRVQPPLPKGYFGNGIVETIATGLSGEVATKPLGYAVSRVRNAVEQITDSYVRSIIAYLENQEDLTKFQMSYPEGSGEGFFVGNPNMSVINLLNLELMGFDFGWGKEVFAGSRDDTDDGESFIMPSPEGDGSVLVNITLQVDHMDAFKKHFYEDIMYCKL